MIETKYFISYKTLIGGMGNVVTDVTPARWCMYRKVNTKETHIIMYAEEISPALAAEITKSSNVSEDYFKEV